MSPKSGVLKSILRLLMGVCSGWFFYHATFVVSNYNDKKPYSQHQRQYSRNDILVWGLDTAFKTNFLGFSLLPAQLPSVTKQFSVSTLQAMLENPFSSESISIRFTVEQSLVHNRNLFLSEMRNCCSEFAMHSKSALEDNSNSTHENISDFDKNPEAFFDMIHLTLQDNTLTLTEKSDLGKSLLTIIHAAQDRVEDPDCKDNILSQCSTKYSIMRDEAIQLYKSYFETKHPLNI